jgi:hypothetical protein
MALHFQKIHYLQDDAKLHIFCLIPFALPKKNVSRHALQETLSIIIVQALEYSPFSVDKTLREG